MIAIKNIKKYFYTKKEIFKAVDDLTFEIYPGETLGLVGESGSGKSTVGRLLLSLLKPTSGKILFEEKDIASFDASSLKQFRKTTQMIFQDPYSSLNPRMTIQEIIAEPLHIHQIGKKKEREDRVIELLSSVGLLPSFASRFPHELSGGQKQRVGIARALSTKPQFIVCDEPISALDVSIQAQIVTLLKKLQKDLNLTYLFISHDLSMVKYLSHRIAVMYLGKIVEVAPTSRLYLSPLHPYTSALISSIPVPDPTLPRKKPLLLEEIASDVTTQGCVFCRRCPKAMPLCKISKPGLKEIKPGHQIACHLY